mmetsp:Transcript_16255/g.35566  ORF Transcript_16255/g.35566 Transcript_16255/m.35566 type:complete len:304 (+) Transcript_16255:330-1241(+)
MKLSSAGISSFGQDLGCVVGIRRSVGIGCIVGVERIVGIGMASEIHFAPQERSDGGPWIVDVSLIVCLEPWTPLDALVVRLRSKALTATRAPAASVLSLVDRAQHPRLEVWPSARLKVIPIREGPDIVTKAHSAGAGLTGTEGSALPAEVVLDVARAGEVPLAQRFARGHLGNRWIDRWHTRRISCTERGGRRGGLLSDVQERASLSLLAEAVHEKRAAMACVAEVRQSHQTLLLMREGAPWPSSAPADQVERAQLRLVEARVQLLSSLRTRRHLLHSEGDARHPHLTTHGLKEIWRVGTSSL